MLIVMILYNLSVFYDMFLEVIWYDNKFVVYVL